MNKCISLALITLAMAASGCGVQQQLDNLHHDQDIQNERIELDKRELQGQLDSQNQAIGILFLAFASSVSNLNTLSAQLNAAIATYNQEMPEVQLQVSALRAAISSLQTTAIAQQTALATLQLQDTVVSYVDPCGPSGGFDEIFMRTSTGKLVAYFEDGAGNRHLIFLTPGSYTTTDSQRCALTVNANGQVCDRTGCH